MSKLTLSDVSNLLDTTTSKATINSNSALIETAVENTLSRDGSTPNQMNADLDMNSHRVYNLHTPINALDAVTKTYVDDNISGILANAIAGIAGEITVSVSDGRERLTGNRVYYVRSDGSDSNTGLANLSGSAFLTIQKAIDTVYGLDMNGKVVSIFVADGTYTGAVSQRGPIPGGGILEIIGNTATPASCIVHVTGGDCFEFNFNTVASIRGFKLKTTTSGSTIRCGNSSYLTVESIIFDQAAESHISAESGCTIFAPEGYIVSGSAVSHIHCTGGALVALVGGITYNAPTFSAYNIGIAGHSTVDHSGAVMTGTATGPRFAVHDFAEMNQPGAADLTYVPGTTAGTLEDFGLIVGSSRWGRVSSGGADWEAFTAGVTSGTGTVTATAAGHFRKSEKAVKFTMTIPVTTASTGGQYILVTLPTTCRDNCAVAAVNASTGVSCMGQIQATAGTVVIRKYDGTYPVADGQSLVVTGTYESVN